MKNPSINNPYIARSPMVAARLLGGEMMIMSAVDSTLFSLNEVATAIWQGADGATRLEEIVRQHVCPEFDVEPALATEDAEGFVAELAAHGVLLVSDQPISAPAPPRESP
ncbi:MAG: PqqD family protein [Acidobacteria bacterium]|nr:PqqD family protein [Acidobacteriota bacterium]